MRIVEIATQRRVTILMFTVAVFLFGIVSLTRLKVNLLPDLSYPTLTVRTELVGAAPVEIENLLSKPVEEAVGVIKNVRQVRSVSRSGQSDVILEFLWGTDMDFAGVEVREKLDLLELPLEASRPLLLRFDPSSEPILRLALLKKAPESDSEQSEEPSLSRVDEIEYLKILRRFAEDRLKTDLESVEGAAAVKVSGGYEDEIQILVDQKKLSQLDLSIKNVAERIRAENINLSGGRLEQGDERFLVRTINEYRSVPEFADTIISTPQGRPVYLRDVADVRQGEKERQAITRINDTESVELAVYKEGDANTVQVANGVKKRVERIKESMPDDMELTLVYDQSGFISAAINQVTGAAIIGGILAILVLYFFLRDSRATFIIGLAIPVSVIGTFVLMYSSELTLNIMSLGGIALAIGLLVDNAIVVLENIVRKKEQGCDSVEAATKGTSEVGTAIIAATLTTVAVFFPMVFVSGIAGQLFRDQALTVTFALLFSLVVALTLIPMLAAGKRQRFTGDTLDLTNTVSGSGWRTWGPRLRVLVTRLAAWFHRIRVLSFKAIGTGFRIVLTPFVWLFQRFYTSADRIYRPVLAWSLNHRFVVLLTALLIFAGSMSLVPRLGVELIPQLSQGEFIVDLRLEPGTPLAQTDAAMRLAQESAQELSNLDTAYSVAGTGNRLDANPVDAGEHSGTLNINLKPGANRADEDAAMGQMRNDLQRIPGIQYEFSRPTLLNVSNPLEIEVTGYDLVELARVSQSIVQAMEESGRYADIRSTVEAGNPEVQIIFNHDRAANLGLVVRDVADRVVSNVRGDVATRYSWRDRKIDVLVRSVDTRDSSISEISQLIINPASQRPVTLDAIADIKIESGPAEIRRLDQERVALIYANLNYGDLGTAVTEMNSILANIPMPRGVTTQVSGQSEEMQESIRSMQFALAMAIFLVYLVMASQFESLIHPFVILFTIPLALVGAVLALYITGTSLNVVAFIGIIMLAGIVVNNAIVLVDFVNQLRAQGKEKHVALMEAGEARLRPILMTTLTTALGLLPMAIGFGEGSEVRAPMAVTVIGGLLVSTLLTLLVIPVVYSLLDRKKFQAVTAA